MFQLVSSTPAKAHPSSIVKLFRTHVDISTPMFTLKVPNAYLTAVRDSHNPKKRKDLSATMLRLYLNLAAAVITIITGDKCSTKLPIANGKTCAATLPYLAEILSQQAAWKQPKPKKQCFTLPMF